MLVKWTFKGSIKRASADVGFIFVAYNLRRLFNLVEGKELKAYLKALSSSLFSLLASMRLNRSPKTAIGH